MVFQEELVHRHRLFWHKGTTGAPLLAVRPFEPLGRLEIPLPDEIRIGPDRRLEAGMLDIPYLLRQRPDLSEYRPGIGKDALPMRTPCPWVPWMEAITGCSIYYDPESGSMWSQPPANSIEERTLPTLVNQEWLDKLLEFTEALTQDAPERYFVTHTLMRGPMDMVASLLGDEGMCLLIYDDLLLLSRLLAECTEIFIQVAQAQYERIPGYHDGYCSPFGIWAPGPVIRNQFDHSSLVSPESYESIFLPYDEEVFKAFEYSIMHIHSTNLKMLDIMLEVDSLTAIQVTLDLEPAGPPLREVMDTLKRISAVKPLLIEGRMTEQELEQLVETLSSDGLYIGATIEST